MSLMSTTLTGERSGEGEVRPPPRCRFLERSPVGVVDPRARSWRGPPFDAPAAVASGDEWRRAFPAPCISRAPPVRADCASLSIVVISTLEAVPVSSSAKTPSKRRFVVVPPLLPLTRPRAEDDADDGVAVMGVPRAPGNFPGRSSPRGASAAGQKSFPFFLLLLLLLLTLPLLLLRLPPLLLLLLLLLANRGGWSDVAAAAEEAYSRV